MSLLDAAQAAARELGLAKITSVVGSSNQTATQLLALANAEIESQRRLFNWPALTKAYSFSLVAGQDGYALPGDCYKILNNTAWDISSNRPLQGSISPQYWQLIKSGFGPCLPYSQFRVFGSGARRFKIQPTPGADDAGTAISIEYMSKNGVLPACWAASIAYATGAFCSNSDGVIYKATSSGVSGSTEPNHTTGTATDGTISWAVYTEPYDKFRSDTDSCVLGDTILRLGIKWRWFAGKKFNFDTELAEYNDEVTALMCASAPAPTVSLCSQSNAAIFPTAANIPLKMEV